MIRHQLNRVNGLVLGLCAVLFGVSLCLAGDQPQWGQRHSRNMVSQETNLPDSFDPESGQGIKWSVSLGREAYGSPVVAGGRVLVGANNKQPRDPRYGGDRAVLLCLNESDGALCWQLPVPRIAGGDIYKDWPNISMCSPPTVEGDRVYILTNRVEVICLDLKGQRNGNQGFQGEAAYLTAPDESPVDVTLQDADLLWVTDLRKEVDMYPHDSAHASILIDGDLLYLNSSNGVDKTHKTIQRPEAPSLIVLNKKTGRCVAQDGERIGPQIFHSAWSSPSMARIGSTKQVIFAGGDGVVYGLEALDAKTPPQSRQILKQLWRFDCDPAAPKEDVRSY
ncbi:MAG: PQQ-binding-like beta-propeller repeat protein, partial [Planctomycetes bacterium]|nr:PQQ-binding-like beta-propeller repeat protein [Planctomycetota bacterium]